MLSVDTVIIRVRKWSVLKKWKRVILLNDLSNLFINFNEKLVLTDTYKENIRKGRDALRGKINAYYIDNGLTAPKHSSQGSFHMHTAIMPKEEEDFDLDNGVYLQGYATDQTNWPTTLSVHDDIISAVEGHTKEISDKDTCIRVNYQDNYHIDLPIYIMGKDGSGKDVAYLAHTTKNRQISDPKAFSDWFTEKVKEHGKELRRTVRYIKAWTNHNSINLKGITITILASECFYSEENGPLILLGTITNILDRLEDDFTCYKPVRPKHEDLLSSYTYYEQQTLLEDLKTLKNKINDAIYDSPNEREASEMLRELFGSRFPLGSSENKNREDYLKTNEPESVGGKNRHYA